MLVAAHIAMLYLIFTVHSHRKYPELPFLSILSPSDHA